MISENITEWKAHAQRLSRLQQAKHTARRWISCELSELHACIDKLAMLDPKKEHEMMTSNVKSTCETCEGDSLGASLAAARARGTWKPGLSHEPGHRKV